MVGKVIGVCVSQRRTDPKKNVGKGFLQAHPSNDQGYSILPREGVFCKVMESGKIRVNDHVEFIRD